MSDRSLPGISACLWLPPCWIQETAQDSSHHVSTTTREGTSHHLSASHPSELHSASTRQPSQMLPTTRTMPCQLSHWKAYHTKHRAPVSFSQEEMSSTHLSLPCFARRYWLYQQKRVSMNGSSLETETFTPHTGVPWFYSQHQLLTPASY